MKRGFLKVMIFCNILFLCCLLGPGGYICADEPAPDKDEINELKSTIQKQEETIKQLQAESKKLQEEINQIMEKQKPNPVVKALRADKNSATRQIEVKDGLVRVTFTNFHDIVYFFDTGAEEHARRDLDIFLKTANLSKGTIEYYDFQRKLFSITGSLTSEEINKYY